MLSASWQVCTRGICAPPSLLRGCLVAQLMQRPLCLRCTFHLAGVVSLHPSSFFYVTCLPCPAWMGKQRAFATHASGTVLLACRSSVSGPWHHCLVGGPRPPPLPISCRPPCCEYTCLRLCRRGVWGAGSDTGKCLVCRAAASTGSHLFARSCLYGSGVAGGYLLVCERAGVLPPLLAIKKLACSFYSVGRAKPFKAPCVIAK